MLRIPTEQASELDRRHADAFVDRALAFVRAELPPPAGDVTRDEIDALVRRAQVHGLTTEVTIVAYVLAARLLGHDFEERLPAAREILEADSSPEYKALLLEELTLATLEDAKPTEE